MKTHINAGTGRALMEKLTDEAQQLIEEMVANN